MNKPFQEKGWGIWGLWQTCELSYQKVTIKNLLWFLLIDFSYHWMQSSLLKTIRTIALQAIEMILSLRGFFPGSRRWPHSWLTKVYCYYSSLTTHFKWVGLGCLKNVTWVPLAYSTLNCEQERMENENESPGIYRQQDCVESQYDQVPCQKKKKQ